MNCPLGKQITKAERIAPKGMYRVVLVDMACSRIYLVEDCPDYRAALKRAKIARTAGDHMVGFAIHDDTGKVIDPAGECCPVQSGLSKFLARQEQIVAA